MHLIKPKGRMKRISSSSTTKPPPPPPEHPAISNHNPIPRDENKKKEKEKKAKAKTRTKQQRIERKVQEKIRRERLKKLYSTLASLLPPNPASSMERMTTPEKVEEAVEYIKTLQQELKEAEEKKEKLVSTVQGGRRSSARKYDHTAPSGSMVITPKMEIKELGSGLEVVLITGLEHQFMFHEVIRILHQETMEVLNANFSTLGDTIYHCVHGKIEESMFCFRADTIKEKLNRLVGLGMSCDDDDDDDDDDEEEAGKDKDQAHDQAQQKQQQQLMWDSEVPFYNWDFTFHH